MNLLKLPAGFLEFLVMPSLLNMFDNKNPYMEEAAWEATLKWLQWGGKTFIRIDVFWKEIRNVFIKQIIVYCFPSLIKYQKGKIGLACG